MNHDRRQQLGSRLAFLLAALKRLVARCEVRVTQSGEEAIRVAPNFSPGWSFLDLNMPPGIDGYQTAVELKEQGCRATRHLLLIPDALTLQLPKTSGWPDSDT